MQTNISLQMNKIKKYKKIKDISGIDFKNSAEMLAVRNGIVLFKMAETL